MEENKEPEMKRLAEYDEGFVPEYRKGKMRVEIVEVGETHDAKRNDAPTGGERVVAQTQEVQPASVKRETSPEMPGKIRITMTGDTLKGVLAAIKALATEVKFQIRKEGITITQIDPRHICLIKVEIPSTAMMEYWSDTGDMTTDIALDAERLSKLMTFRSGDQVTLELEKQKTVNATIDNGSIRTKIILLDEESVEVPRVPLITSEDFAVLPTRRFMETLRTAKLISDAVRITFDRETVTMKASSDEEHSETVFPKDELKELVVRGPGKVLYPLEYLEKIAKAARKADEIRMTLKEDYPTRIDFHLPVGRGATEKIHITYLLAPRMEP